MHFVGDRPVAPTQRNILEGPKLWPTSDYNSLIPLVFPNRYDLLMYVKNRAGVRIQLDETFGNGGGYSSRLVFNPIPSDNAAVLRRSFSEPVARTFGETRRFRRNVIRIYCFGRGDRFHVFRKNGGVVE